jgi:tetratricopeptide (TPR) repeat protein
VGSQKIGINIFSWLYYLETGMITLLIIGVSLSGFEFWNESSEALSYYENILESDPKNVVALNNIGVQFTLQGKYLMAIESFNKGLEIDPHNAALLYNKGLIMENDDLNISKKYISKALKLYPQLKPDKEGLASKTQITSIIKDSIPKRHIIKLNNATESSLFGRGNIEGTNHPDKKIFYLGDLGDKNAMTHTAPYRKHIRELLSDGETTRELSDTNKPKEGDRPILTETLIGYPPMIYSTVRDGEIEQQETDRAIELTWLMVK